jgi:hypothetical protein
MSQLRLLIIFLVFLFQRREKTLLDPALAEDALVVPCKGVLKICAMSLPVSPLFLSSSC